LSCKVGFILGFEKGLWKIFPHWGWFTVLRVLKSCPIKTLGQIEIVVTLSLLKSTFPLKGK